MRNGQQQQKRMRGRNNNNRRGSNPLTRVYESNGPDVKVRGTAHHIAEKYQQLARDAQSSSDPVAAENYLQHAEHYLRLIASLQGQFAPPAGYGREEDGDEDDAQDDVSGYDAPQPYMREQGGSNREGRDSRDNREGREPRENREPRDNREQREPRGNREPREGGRGYRDNRESRDNRDRDRDNRDRDYDRDNRDNRDRDNRSSNYRRPRHEEEGELVAQTPVPAPVPTPVPAIAPAPVVREPVAEVVVSEAPPPAARVRTPRAPRAPRAETRVTERPDTENQLGLPSFITGAPVVAPAPRAVKAAAPVAEDQDDGLEAGEARTGRRRRRYRSRLDQADETSGGEDAPEAAQRVLASE